MQYLQTLKCNICVLWSTSPQSMYNIVNIGWSLRGLGQGTTKTNAAEKASISPSVSLRQIETLIN